MPSPITPDGLLSFIDDIPMRVLGTVILKDHGVK
jgi:hypothetical protein